MKKSTFLMHSHESLKNLIESHFDNFPFDSLSPKNLYEPMSYILKMKGKRIRPILTLMAYKAVSGEEIERALNLASGVELFHNFTLMHDDIMDKAPVRRGKPTVHKVWNTDIAILSGDAMFAYSMGLIMQGFEQRAAQLGLEFSKVAMEVCEGQMEDMDFEERNDVTIPDYLEMIRKKTAALLGGCMSLGAIAGGADQRIVKLFRAFGESLGIGFQLQDDLMDAFPPEGFGKQVGGDILVNKKTFLVLKALELAKGADKEELEFLLSTSEDHPEKVEKVLNIFRKLDIENHTAILIKEYFDKARSMSKELGELTDFEALKEYLQSIFKRKL
ncbi:MAG: polyprenyl synthetase family protein [Bacteroidota bacterium]